MTEYISRIKISLHGDNNLNLYTKSGLKLSSGYDRVVIGARGPYVEISEEQLLKVNVKIPESEFWRLESDIVYYTEYRSIDSNNVKIYFQRKRVNYADYIVGKYYISPFDLKTDDLPEIITSPTKESSYNSDIFF